MGRGRFWTEADVSQLLKLRTDGKLSVPEIARAIDRTTSAIWAKLTDMQNNDRPFRDGDGIGETGEDRYFAKDAREGSAALLSEIRRVFGRAA